MSTGPGVPRRSAGLDGVPEVSVLAFTPTLTAPANERAVSVVAQLLRRCNERGVTCFDLVEAPSFPLGLLSLATAFPDPTPDLVVIVPSRLAEGGAVPDPTRLPTASGAPMVGKSGSTAAGPAGSGWLRRVSVLIERGPGTESLHDPRAGPLVSPTGAPESPLPEVVRCGNFEELRRESQRAPHALFSTELSLLHPTHPGEEDPAGWLTQPRCLARNVLSTGQLDGSSWEATRTPQGRPLAIRDLELSYSNILRLGFLTAGRRRTLAQAALAYPLGKPWVLTACVPLPSAARLDELLRFAETPALSARELAVIEGQGSARQDPGRPRAGG